jgi:predicted deacylase
VQEKMSNHQVKDESIQTEKIEKKLDSMNNEKMEAILRDFEEFKSYLGEKVEAGKRLGLSEEMLAKGAEKVAAYLANNVEPRNSEENLLNELWKVGNDEERHFLAHMLVKLANGSN